MKDSEKRKVIDALAKLLVANVYRATASTVANEIIESVTYDADDNPQDVDPLLLHFAFAINDSLYGKAKADS